ncbi:NAD(P)/FAD-dependent oxidoreductase [Arthrobacter sp. H14-L1]|uniref:NAD(P)/FAD-dependent oxidoreductase n=1 Tax=Arthrobacter sp. H14-L1 TaxID=2996697 RepID=UPI00226EA757|nr:FAD/NAD(P)-binding oxidoreductase [Arthrobacter sp. H14-L1]MCY0903334.1 FAD/NAD(P)-binding oxidoreductase [Arthrobacter sp. H14-L1]
MATKYWSSTLDADPAAAPPAVQRSDGAEHHAVVIIGGGNAGISLAARLHRYGFRDIVIVEPSNRHLYQPLFSHIGGGTARAEEAVRPQADVMPKSVRWIRDAAVDIAPQAQTVLLASGTTLAYRQLVICPGMRLDWDAVPGLAAAMSTPSASSNYVFELAPKTWDLIRGLQRGTAVFTMPSGTVKCDGATQKIMYLACDYWRQEGVLDDIRVVMVVPTRTVYGVDVVDEELNRKIAEYGVELRCSSEVTAVDGAAQTVTISAVTTSAVRASAVTHPPARARPAAAGSEVLRYDLLHGVPPQVAPDWLRTSGLTRTGDQGGFVDVNPETLQHSRYRDIWSLGDAAGTKNFKSGASLRKQTLALAKNLKAASKGKAPRHKYNHYSATPFTVSRSTVVFAEFDHLHRPKPTLPWKGSMKEHHSTWILERNILPRVYWHLILKGRA